MMLSLTLSTSYDNLYIFTHRYRWCSRWCYRSCSMRPSLSQSLSLVTNLYSSVAIVTADGPAVAKSYRWWYRYHSDYPHLYIYAIAVAKYIINDIPIAIAIDVTYHRYRFGYSVSLCIAIDIVFVPGTWCVSLSLIISLTTSLSPSVWLFKSTIYYYRWCYRWCYGYRYCHRSLRPTSIADTVGIAIDNGI